MHLIIGLVTAIYVLFPASDTWGMDLYKAWMDAYEKYLYQQMYDNFERARNEQETGKEEVQEAVRSDAGRNAGVYSESNRSICGSGLGRNNGKVCGSGQQDNGNGDRVYSELGGSSAGRDGVTNEQTASEETTKQFGIVADRTGTTGQGSAEKEPTVGVVTAPEMESQTESRTEDGRMDENGAPAEVVREVTPLYSVNGAILREDLQEYLYRRLCEAGIGWFFEPSLWIMYQESRFNPLAENPNGRDKGILQYRVEFYAGLDWTNPYAEMDLFIQQMANRAYAGCDVKTMISRHNTSDWGAYNPEYVAQVTQWQGVTVRVR